ncbi:MAG: UDP-glucose 4-epimerase GalE [Pseudomonadota bacterium]
MNIMLTGGCGYIGSHTYVALKEAGYEPVILDNFSNSSPEVLTRLCTLFQSEPIFVHGDIRNRNTVRTALNKHKIDAVIHLAGTKAVGESGRLPLKYFSNNVSGCQTLFETMDDEGVRKVIFSSSATVYGEPEYLPLDEKHPLAATSIYGDTKLIAENMLNAVHRADPRWSIIKLRYFNPIGAHPSGLIGEDPLGLPNNLMPYITQVAVGKLPKLQVFGGDYDTPDGTGVRDYIHVDDLARGHVAAVRLLDQPQCTPINLGTGTGYSVFEMIRALEVASGRKVNYEVVARRPGDISTCYADPSLMRSLTGWVAQNGLEEMCRDAWHWQSENPQGFRMEGEAA